MRNRSKRNTQFIKQRKNKDNFKLTKDKNLIKP